LQLFNDIIHLLGLLYTLYL